MAALSFNGNMLAYNGYALYAGEWPGPGLPPYTIKLQYSVGDTPKFKKGTATQLSADPNIWLLTYKNRYWSSLLRAIDQEATLLSVIEANTAGVMDMTEMFNGCERLSYLCPMDTSNVFGMSKMFTSCHSLRTIPNLDTSRCTNMSGMFSSCIVLNEVPQLNTSKCTNMSGMFAECTSLKSVPLLDSSKCTDMSLMFEMSGLLTSPVFDTSKCTNMSQMYRKCFNLKEVPLLDTSVCTNMDEMFLDCYKVEGGALALYQQAIYQTTPPSSHDGTFWNCGINTTTGAAELAQIPADWK